MNYTSKTLLLFIIFPFRIKHHERNVRTILIKFENKQN